ncbi:uncharacterized protein N7496_008479 [Penicillium cataractarum]|uniref:Alpha and gamma adaptin binding protein p34 n=1 Tax=Penicillium cataractarum TaxID=2100454 RepID=A0A9W9S138_9EURO|nr:uncharacterized protein N7496_008479 [Penicillium cataractarum]KAJ5368719.1 hypothetical protein N7496_008479 [Penicillium cataractarum]
MTPMASGISPVEPSKSQSKHIANPRRLLILTPTSQSLSIIPPLLHSLTGVPVIDPPQHDSTSESPSQTPPQPSDNTSTPTTTTTTSFAGYTTHSPLRLDTKYYSAEIPLWVDEIPLTTETPAPAAADPTNTSEPGQWRTEFLSEEAEIVRDAVGALVVCVRSPELKQATPSTADADTDPASRADVRAVLDLMRDVGAVKSCIDEERGGNGDVVGVFVLVGSRSSAAPKSSAPDEERALELGVDDVDLGDGAADTPFSVGWWEDQLFDLDLFGWEVVEWDPAEQGVEKTRNKFGEYEGMPRIKEVLETHDWSTSGGADDLNDADLDFADDLEEELLGFGRSSHTSGFGHEVQELEREMMGLRMAIERGGGDGDEGDIDGDDADGELKVESIETLMMRMQAIRDMGSELPEGERRKFAAKAVSDIMREL